MAELAPRADVPEAAAKAFELVAPSPAAPRTARPAIEPLSPQRYRVQFTIGQETHDAVTRLKALMRRELPDGDLAAIFDQGVRLLLAKVEKAKFGVGAKRRPRRAKKTATDRAYETRIRFETDNRREADRKATTEGNASTEGNATTDENATTVETGRDGCGEKITRRTSPSRDIPNAVKRAVWWRDRGQCAFVSEAGHRCTQRVFLELHHIHPYALDGPATGGNVSLRCRVHNAYEAELVFGPRPVAAQSEAP